MFVTSLDLPLRGRERELSYIRDILAYGRTAGNTLLVIEGPPGSGKTRLLRACAALAEEMGYATPGDGRPARRPVLARGRRGRPHPEPAAARFRPHVRLPGGRPLLLLLDEADRLGDDAVEALLARRAALHGSPAVSVVAHRTGKGPAALGAVLATPTGRREHLTLGPLDADASARIAADVLGMPPSPALTEMLDRAHGHPRLLIALLTGLREERALREVDGEAHVVARVLPQRVRTQVAATMATFTPDCRQLLRTAAVLGHELEYEVLAPLLRTSPTGLVRLLDEAVGTGAVHSDGTGTVFRGDLLRRAIAGTVPASLKRALLREADQVRRDRARGAQPPPAAGVALNDRQSAVVRLVAEGLTNQQIARRLDVSPHTVNYHLRKLFGSYGVRSRIDLLRAVENQRERADCT
ncbi:LuxR C-terminal-related transcriptional regulator [Streptomyces sp. NPDC093595]|uniref:helix-turn-helix transcriptional regulator n=1 Tax=Streptomyces sp. NPDC093595 TaxID=3366045 RepID=UPI003812D8E9